MKIRVKITPARLERLMAGEPLNYAVGNTEIEIVMADDVFSKFDAIFEKISKIVNKTVEKIESAILK
jgi:hypothetical protein